MNSDQNLATQVSDYITFLLALGTYLRYFEETGLPADEHAAQGLLLWRRLSADSDQILLYLRDRTKDESARQRIERAFGNQFTAKSASRSATFMSAALRRGKLAMISAIFKESQKVMKVKSALEAASEADPDKALDEFSVIVVKNQYINEWIDTAAANIGSGLPPPPVVVVDRAGVGSPSQILEASLTSAPGTEESAEASRARENLLVDVERQAEAAALKSFQAARVEDLPAKKSEVVALATATVAAALSNPEDERNVPEPLRSLDPEQRAAAVTGGRVLLVAAAGSGKTATVTSRVEYLVKDKKVSPSKVLVCSFNRKAAKELQDRLAKKCGESVMKQMSVGTMHSLARRFIVGDRSSGVPPFGTVDEQGMFSVDGRRLIADGEGHGPRGPSPLSLTMTARAVWKDCSPYLAKHYNVSVDLSEPPKAKKASTLISQWVGNDVSPAQALANARTATEKKVAIFYDLVEGLKGAPGWSPPGGGSNAYDKWMNKYRPAGERLADLDDMVTIFRDILRRNPVAKATIQGMYDHVVVDEAQDQNSIQAETFDLMTEHVDSDDRSYWVVGDPDQSIYGFRGARADIFNARDGREGWKTKKISTNYRCDPAIVEAANSLIANNKGRIPKDARPNPRKVRNPGAVEVQYPADNVAGAVSVLTRIEHELRVNPTADPSDYAVLSRTNAELNDYETACIISGVPYSRAGGSSFLEAPETKAMLGYLTLARGSDFERMQEALISCLTKPDRGLFMGASEVEKIVAATIKDIARENGEDPKAVNPLSLVMQERYAERLAYELKRKFSSKFQPRMFNYIVKEMTNSLLNLGTQVGKIKKLISDESTTAEGAFEYVLDNVTATTGYKDSLKVTSLREQIASDLAVYSDEDEGEPPVPEPKFDDQGNPIIERSENPAQGLGAVQFLYMLTNSNDQDIDAGRDPKTAGGFMKKIESLSEAGKSLRVDLKKWAADQAKLPQDKREARPKCMILSTIHSTKGAEWPNCFVLMSGNTFPPRPKIAPGDPPPPPEEAEKILEQERNLAYVALTRAERSLTVVAAQRPSRFIAEAGIGVAPDVVKTGAVTGVYSDLTFDPDSELDLWLPEPSVSYTDYADGDFL